MGVIASEQVTLARVTDGVAVHELDRFYKLASSRPDKPTSINTEDVASGTSITVNNSAGDSLMQCIVQGKSVKQNLIPDGYTQVEYLQSTGTQYIDLGRSVPTTNKFSIRCAWGSATGNYPMWGAIDGTSYTDPFYGLTYTTVIPGRHYAIYCHSTTFEASSYAFKSGVGQDENFHTFSSGGNFDFYCDGVLMTPLHAYPYTHWTPINHAILFGRRRDDTLNLAEAGSKISHYKEWDSNDNLLYNLVPCYRNSDSEVGMYDTVNDVFYANNGTGEFTAGPYVGHEILSVQRNDKIYVKNLSNSTIAETTIGAELRCVGVTYDTKNIITGDVVRRIGYIASYNGEEVGDEWISSTDALTTGATVIYKLPTETTETGTAQAIATPNGTMNIITDSTLQPNMNIKFAKINGTTIDMSQSPVILPPTGWAATEPAYHEGATDNLYTTDLTVYSDGNTRYSDVSLSSSYAASKTAYNKAITKNAVHYQTTPPTAGKINDVWFDTSDDNKMYRWTGSEWEAKEFGAGSINVESIFAQDINATGTINGAVLTGGSYESHGDYLDEQGQPAGTVDVEILNGELTLHTVIDNGFEVQTSIGVGTMESNGIEIMTRQNAQSQWETNFSAGINGVILPKEDVVLVRNTAYTPPESTYKCTYIPSIGMCFVNIYIAPRGATGFAQGTAYIIYTVPAFYRPSTIHSLTMTNGGLNVGQVRINPAGEITVTPQTGAITKGAALRITGMWFTSL